MLPGVVEKTRSTARAHSRPITRSWNSPASGVLLDRRQLGREPLRVEVGSSVAL